MKNKVRFVFSLLISFSLTGCFSNTETSQSSSERSVSYADPYEDPSITEDYLEQSLCMVFEDLRFVKGEGGRNDHAFAMKDGKVAEHRSYERKERSLSDFQAIVGSPLFDAMETIGIPSFRGRYDEGPSLTYVISPESYATIYIEKDFEGKWMVSLLKTFDENEFSKDFEKVYTSNNEQQSILSAERVRSISMGMLFDNVLSILGRPFFGRYYASDTSKKCSGSWYIVQTETRKRYEVQISARWIDSDYPAFNRNNCAKDNSAYFGVVYLEIFYS